MQIDVEAIKRQLFDDPAVRVRIIRDYDIDFLPTDAHELASAVLGQLEQEPASRPLEQTFDNADVFRAAVRALDSNSRAWATFLRHERRLSGLLVGYDPVESYRATERGELSLEQLKACLPGQSSTADARAILRWARLLTEVEHYYEFIQDLGAVFWRLSMERHGEPISDADLMLCLVGYLGQPPKDWEGSRYLGRMGQHVRADQQKTPGMGYVLASEFLRNLGWDGFKPDRHVQRLFDRWFPNRDQGIQDKAQRLQPLIGRATRDLSTFLTYSLAGATAAPGGVPLSRVDNLVWLLGAYVERKGRESSRTYLTEMAE